MMQPKALRPSGCVIEDMMECLRVSNKENTQCLQSDVVQYGENGTERGGCGKGHFRSAVRT
jgi:hypothetical protein